MNRKKFYALFEAHTPVIIPVIHALNNEQVYRNISIAMDMGASGVFLINHDFGIDRFLPIVRHSRQKFEDIWLGVNFLAVSGRYAFPILGQLTLEGYLIDAYWADDACINERTIQQCEAEEIDRIRKISGWNGLYFGGTAFKKQRNVEPDKYSTAARLAKNYMDVVTTSGAATGIEAHHEKISEFRKGVGNNAMALASGITPGNARQYGLVDCFMVATGINKDRDFYNINANKLSQLQKITRDMRSLDDR